jgi:hypothetical protein
MIGMKIFLFFIALPSAAVGYPHNFSQNNIRPGFEVNLSSARLPPLTTSFILIAARSWRSVFQ